MQALLTTGVLNALAATVIAVGAFAIAAVWRNPFVNRGLWLAVLLKFVIPPLVLLPLVEWPRSDEPHAAAMVSVESQVPPQSAPTSDALMTSALISPEATSLRYGTFPPDSTVPPTSRNHQAELFYPVLANPPTSTPPLPEATPYHAPRPSVGHRTSWEDTIDIAAILWLAGALAFSCIALLRVVSFHRALTRAALASESIQSRAAELAVQAGMPATPVVRITSGRTPPLAWRVLYGSTILLPAELIERLSAPELDAILAHELTHLHRGDDRFRWLEFVIVTAFWWCPSAWFARRRLHEAEERCCDADVLRTFPALASHYASALLAALDCLGPAPRHVVGTPFFNRGSLVRRFESITASRQPRRPSHAMSGLLAAAGIALLVVTPIAAAAEADAENDAKIEQSEGEPPVPPVTAAPADPSPPDSYGVLPPSANESNGVAVELDQTLTVRLPDGQTRDGRVVFERGIPVFIWDSVRPASEPTPALSPSVEPGLEMWDVSFGDCLALIIKNNRLGFVTTEEFHVLRFAPEPSATITLEDASTGLTNQFRDVEDAYWELWYCYKNLDAAKGGRDLALETWRRVKTLQRAGSVGGEDNSEAESRAHYYLLRARVEVARSDLFRVENRLRYLLGLAVEDGRLIRPSDEPTTAAFKVNFEALQAKAKTRIELVVARQKARHADLLLARADAILADVAASDPHRSEREDEQRVAATLAGEQNRKADDIELVILHQLRDAIRDVELNHSIVGTNRNRRAAAADEVSAVGRLYEVGQITLDRVLLAQIRQADAESAYARSLADYSRAIERLHFRTGATITAEGYRLEQAAAENSPPITHGWGIRIPAWTSNPYQEPQVDAPKPARAPYRY
jgi:beta-lactamase regulating signal transducer with metallopeptidase domain